jgi:hypothetical protein
LIDALVASGRTSLAGTDDVEVPAEHAPARYTTFRKVTSMDGRQFTPSSDHS